MIASTQENSGEAQARRLESVSDQVTALLRQPEVAERLRAGLGENEWSAMQILGHLVEMIPYWLNHCQRLITATAELPQFGRTLDAPERLAGVEHGVTGSPDELLRRLNEEVQAGAQAIRQMSPAERDQKGSHVSRGEMTVAGIIELFIVAHAEDHLAQMRTALRIK
jgi:uncharacterized damage-inducible protein DinB